MFCFTTAIQFNGNPVTK